MSDPFKSPESDQTLENQDHNANPLLTKVMEIKDAEGRSKYDTVEKAIDALAESQKYIPTLKETLEARERELAETKLKMESSQSVEEIVSKLLNQNQEGNQEPKNHQEPTKQIGEEDIAKMIRDRLEADAKTAQIQKNSEIVAQALEAQFGEKAQEEVAKKAKSLGVTPEELGKMATKSPAVVLQLFNNNSNTNYTPASDGGINTSNFQKSQHQELEAPTKSLLSGASAKEQAEYMKKVKADVYSKHGVTV